MKSKTKASEGRSGECFHELECAVIGKIGPKVLPELQS
jgi:hypothetical protein